MCACVRTSKDPVGSLVQVYVGNGGGGDVEKTRIQQAKPTNTNRATKILHSNITNEALLFTNTKKNTKKYLYILYETF